jgi:23S rRNA (pseudouridine1915-N3)-methyltransferase
VEITEVGDERAPETLSAAEIAVVKEREGARLSKFLREDAVKIVLAIEGKSMSSEEFAEKINRYGLAGQSRIDFVIGGSLGLDPAVIKQADLLLSFSRFTFPHQMMRLILLEQIYRAFRILKGEPYHK